MLALTMISTSCNNTSTAERENPLLTEWNTPYGIPPFGEIEVSDYMPAFEAAMEAHKAEIEAIVNNPAEPNFENTILALDNSGAKLSDISNTFFLIAAADTNEKMQKVEVEVSPLLAAHSDEIMMNAELFKRVKSVYQKRKKLGLDKMQMRLTEKTYTCSAVSLALAWALIDSSCTAVGTPLLTASVAFLISISSSLIIHIFMTEISKPEEKSVKLKNTDVLFLDDFGGELNSGFIRDEFLGPILQYRMIAGLPVFMSSNYDIKSLTSHLAETKEENNVIKAGRIIERIVYMMKVVKLEDINYRR